MENNRYDLVLAFVFVSLILLLLIIFSILLFLKYRKKRSAHLLENQKLHFEFNEALLRSQLEIQENTFKAISQEIHDNIGQVLSLAKLHLNTLKPTLATEDGNKIDDAKTLISKALAELRDLSKTLNTDIISSIGLTKAIETELNLLSKLKTVNTSFSVVGPIINLTPQKELILFRIVQETLNNITKHASASNITVIASYSQKELQLVITDDGIGFDTSTTKMDGSGLINIKSRSKLIDADLLIESKKEVGTEVRITLPIEDAQS